MTARYRITYAIERLAEGGDDFEEIGFGSTGSWNTIAAATHDLDSEVTNGEWETEPGQPDPADVLAEIAEATR